MVESNLTSRKDDCYIFQESFDSIFLIPVTEASVQHLITIIIECFFFNIVRVAYMRQYKVFRLLSAAY